MRFVLKYFAKLLPREGFRSLTIPALAFVLVFLINLMGGIKVWLESEYMSMMVDYKIIAEVSDLTGEVTDELMIHEKYMDLFTDPEVVFSLAPFIDEAYMRRELVVMSLGDVDVDFRLVGITGILADDALDAGSGAAIKFYPDYDERLFKTNDRVCVVREDILTLAVSGQLDITVIPRNTPLEEEEEQDAIVTQEIRAALMIGGVISGAGTGLIYAPFQTVGELAVASDGQETYTERLYVTLKDNRALSAFKREASRSFSRVSPIYSSRPYAITVYDSAFYDTIESLRRNIILVETATPVVQFIAVWIGFIASFLLTRRRKPEFALMQSVGIHKQVVFFGALLEQALLCVVGTLAGGIIALMVWRHVSVAESLVFLGFYVFGALFFALRAAGTDVLRILQEKE